MFYGERLFQVTEGRTEWLAYLPLLLIPTLIPAAWSDLRTKTVRLWQLILLGMVGLGLCFIKSLQEIKLTLWLAIPLALGAAAAWLIARRKTRGGIGGADLAATAAVVLGCPAETGIWLLLISFGTAAIAAVILICITKDKERTMPFLPFLFLGTAAGLAVYYL